MHLATEMMRQMEICGGQAKISLPLSGNGIIVDLLMYSPQTGVCDDDVEAHEDAEQNTVVFVLHHSERINSYVPRDHATKRKRAALT